MNSRPALWALAACVGAFSSCSSWGRWKPVVDPRSGSTESLDRDLAECRELAQQASGGTGKETAKGVAAGAIVGAAVGAVLGAVGGDPGEGAATGAALGGVGTGAVSGLSAEQEYKRVYIRCIEGRGHRVLNAR